MFICELKEHTTLKFYIIILTVVVIFLFKYTLKKLGKHQVHDMAKVL